MLTKHKNSNGDKSQDSTPALKFKASSARNAHDIFDVCSPANNRPST